MTGESRVETKIGSLFVEERGSGPAVLLWHSLLCDSSMWRAQASALERDHRLLLVDGPGHGRSSPPPGKFTLEDCADALVSVLDARSVERAALVGLSWGGMTAMRAALRAPARVAALALVDTSASAEPFLARLRYRVMAAIFRRNGLTPALEERVSRVMLGRKTRAERPTLGPELLSRLRAWDREGLSRAISAVVLERRSIAADLSRISVPTLVIVGEDDKATPPRESETIARSIPGARLERIEGSGHLSALEAPERVTALLRDFLKAALSRLD
ncbi:alpha/beta fold hydrolase [bacterium]|nr:alpha/beta fold hydrolase [bacterium]